MMVSSTIQNEPSNRAWSLKRSSSFTSAVDSFSAGMQNGSTANSTYATITPIVEEDDEYGFYCDENGDSGNSWKSNLPFAVATSSSSLSSSTSSLSSFSSLVSTSSNDPISHIHKASSPRFTRRQNIRGIDGQQHHANNFDLNLGPPNLSNIDSYDAQRIAKEEEEVVMEAPVWVVSKGSSKPCAHCSRRILYVARDNTPGRVFSRSFRSSNSCLGSSRSSLRGSFNSSVGSFSGGALFRRDSSNRFHSSESLQSLSSLETLETPTAAAMGAFRVVQGWFPGHKWAEFEIVVSTGSTVYRAWRTHEDFARLVEMIGVRRKHRRMSKANLSWDLVQRTNKWIGGCEMLYLIQKRHILDVFVENLLYEIESPVQFLNFVDDSTWCPEGAAASCTCISSDLYDCNDSRNEDNNSSEVEPQEPPSDLMDCAVAEC